MASNAEIMALKERVRLLEAQLGTLVQRGELASTDESAGRNPAYGVTAYAGLTDTGLERLQDYGFASHPLAGSEAVTLWLNGKRDAALVLAVADRRYRLALNAGEVALYDDRNQKVLLHDGGMDVQVNGVLDARVTQHADIDCPQVNLTGNLYVGGNIVVAGTGSGYSGPLQLAGGLVNTGGDIVSDNISLEQHVHGGVQSGGSDTGVPK